MFHCRLYDALAPEETYLAAKTEKSIMELYNIDTSIPSIENDWLDVDVDETSKQILKSFHPVVLNEPQPLNTRGDGNCLYRAVSLAISGSQKYHVKLKKLTAIEIILNRSNYDTSSRQYNDMIKDDRVVTSTFNYLVMSAVKDGMYSELLHLRGLSQKVVDFLYNKKTIRSVVTKFYM